MNFNFSDDVQHAESAYRSKYPQAQTRIFKVSESKYLIYVENLKIDKDAKEEFKMRIRTMGIPVKLIGEIPDEYLEEIIPFSEEEYFKSLSGFYTEPQQISLFLNKFSFLTNVSFEYDNMGSSVIIKVPINCTDEEVDQIQKFGEKVLTVFSPTVERCEMSPTEKMAVKTTPPKDKADEFMTHIQSPITNLYPSQQQSLKKNYIIQDQEKWFDITDQLYSGEIKKSSFSFISQKEPSVLLDLTNPYHINLRNYLMIYDVIYLILPFKDSIEKALANQHFELNELISLIERGRIKIVLTQPVERLDEHFLDAAFEANKNGVITRHSLSALCLADFFQLRNSFPFASEECIYELTKSANRFPKWFKGNPQWLIDLIAWPQVALRTANKSLKVNGVFALPQVGLPRVFENHPQLKKFDLEAMHTGKLVHIAHALNAHYAPMIMPGYSDSNLAQLFFSVLKMYENPSQVISKTKKTFSLYEGIQINDIFGVYEFMPIDQFAQHFETEFTRTNARSLFSQLKHLDQSERNEQIAKLNQELIHFKELKSAEDFLLSFTKDIGGTFSLPISVFSLILRATGWSKIIQEKWEQFEVKIGTKKSELAFLDKISPAAALRKGKIE